MWHQVGWWWHQSASFRVDNRLFALNLTKETDWTNFEPKLLILVAKVVDHHIYNRHLVNFGGVDFNNSLSIAFS